MPDDLGKPWRSALRLTGRIMTAYVERLNLTLREHIALLSRHTWNGAEPITIFCRYHQTLAGGLAWRC